MNAALISRDRRTGCNLAVVSTTATRGRRRGPAGGGEDV